MAEFSKGKLDMFLGVVRKYMQVRGALSQKDLAEKTEIGVSTMSRFLNRRATELNPQMIAKIVAKLNIPLHEMIDFVEEDYADHFIRLVKFYKDEEVPFSPGEGPAEIEGDDPVMEGEETLEEEFEAGEEDALADALGTGGTAKKNVSGSIKVGGKRHKVSFPQGEGGDFRERISSLTARQKGFIHDFLNLDTDGRDLVVDIGKNIISYLRQKGIDF
ncbi:MAG: helix-turn-helix transcriptional regulator [Halobacteriovoraceae bacterium]|jgi:transcriptional regulator with XRE-family HTH domain|nr:helix-turn-helix transcriptional regulator [Halobacteriovoraceae bacterium]MBT5094483.1 helix-turn-helix transcriptional regulator [Halobacteriovoraceae bacterium]